MLEPGQPYPDELSLVLRHDDTGFTVEQRVRPPDGRRLALAPGRWSAEVRASPGWLLVDVEHDRRHLDGYRATIDADDLGVHQYLTWTFVAAAELSGELAAKVDRPPPCEVHARLVEAGPWLEVEADPELERGRLHRLAPVLAGTGGSLVVEAPSGFVRVSRCESRERAGPAATAARVPPRDPADARLPQELRDGYTVSESLVPARYRAELCADAACGHVTRSWPVVEVGRDRQVEVRTEPAAPASRPR